MICDRCDGKGVEGFIFSLRCKPCGGTGLSGIQSILKVDWKNIIPEYIEVKEGDHKNWQGSKIHSIAITIENTPQSWIGVGQCDSLKNGVHWTVTNRISSISDWFLRDQIDALYNKTDPGIYKLVS